MNVKRRRFLAVSAAGLSGSAFLSSCSKEGPAESEDDETPGSRYGISLAQWSMHRMLRGGELDNLDWPAFTKETFDIDAVEWVNQFFFEEHERLGYQPKGQDYLEEMKRRCDDAGVSSLILMCDRVGNLGDPDSTKRAAAVEGHYAWLDAASLLECHSLRVNAASDPELSPEEQADLCIDGLRRLSERALVQGLNVIVENHGGYSSNGAWLAKVLANVGMPNCGALPDFGNFYVVRNRGDAEQFERLSALYAGDPTLVEDEFGLTYDRYQGMRDLMPFAKGVSAKAHDFDAEGNEIHSDFFQMMRIIDESGYSGHIGIEYEGQEIGEIEGIRKTQALLERAIASVS